MKIAAILLMSGSGNRFGSDLPKQFHNLSGKPIYKHTLEIFQTHPHIDQVLLVCHPDYLDRVDEPAVSGGATRQESSRLGLEALDDDTDIVLIHDAVRPFVTHTILTKNIDAAIKYGAADTCIPTTDTIVQSLNGSQIDQIPLRSELYRGQTPQTFDYKLIRKLHLETQLDNATDDASLAIAAGRPVYIVEGSHENIKITNELDLFIAEQLHRKKSLKPNPTQSLDGKHFVITGGTGEIGAAICSALEAEGASALPLSRTSPLYPTDLSKYDQALKSFTRIGPIDGLINCTGHLLVKPLHHLSPAEIEAQIASNLTALIYACRCAHIRKGGHIINIASSSYSRGRKHYPIYSSTKAAVVNFTQALAEELPTLNVNAIAPKRTLTAMRKTNFPDENPSELLDPQEIAKSILSILKTEAMTGSLFPIT